MIHLQATEAAERDLAGGANHLGEMPEANEKASADDSSVPQAAETDKFRFLSWLRLLLFQLMLDIIEVKPSARCARASLCSCCSGRLSNAYT